MEERGKKEQPEVPVQARYLCSLTYNVCILQIKEEATDKDNKNCSKDGMCGKVRLCLPLSGL